MHILNDRGLKNSYVKGCHASFEEEKLDLLIIVYALDLLMLLSIYDLKQIHFFSD